MDTLNGVLMTPVYFSLIAVYIILIPLKLIFDAPFWYLAVGIFSPLAAQVMVLILRD
ncbi:hypothetical protein TWF718_001058 [Orbilia javanica]|uniref:Uncharacterized protein n=1 Tax=Orbilia javanica TaxID=47235 RepID=A0AAN8RS51_9PEZI